MNVRATLVILCFCSIAWISNSQLLLGNLNVLLALTITFTLIRKWKLLKPKYLIFIVLIVIYIIVSYANSFINEDRRNIIIDIVYSNITEIKDKTKSKYYEEITNSIRDSKTSLPNEALSMSIEVDRSINNGHLVSAGLINYYLNFITEPFLPTCVSLGDNFLSHFLYINTIFFITLSLLIEINSKTKFKGFLWLASLSLLILAIIGIYLKYLYLKGSVNLNSVFFQLWHAPEPRISFSSFSYKNHWSAYVILIISMTFTLIYSIVKESNLLVLRSNKFILLITISIIFCFSVFYSNSNSGIILLSLFLSISVYLVFYKKIKVLNFISIIFCIIIPIFLFYNRDVFNRVHELISGNSFRFYLWNDLIHQIQCKTFWGYGLDSYKAINGIFQSTEITFARQQNLAAAHQLYIPLTRHGHSDFLQTISDVGFIGICLVAFPIVFFILRDVIHFSDSQYPIISLALLIILIYSIVDFPFRNFAVLTMFLFLFARISFSDHRLSHVSSCR